jgi:HSP20 family protein
LQRIFDPGQKQMSFWDRDIDDWIRRFGFGSMMGRGGGSPAARARGAGSIFSEFEQMRREMERMFEETIQDMDRVPKDLIREYETPTGAKVREVGPMVYGYSVTIGPDGKPHVKEFGNVRPPIAGATSPQLTAEREPLADIVTTDNEVKVIVEMPGINKEDINVKAYDNSVEISTTEKAQRKYYRMVEIPSDADTNTVKSTYKNGILEIIFNKKAKPKGKEIKVD